MQVFHFVQLQEALFTVCVNKLAYHSGPVFKELASE